jgi:hypothetical protein
MVEEVAHIHGSLAFAHERSAIAGLIVTTGALGLATFAYRYLSFADFSNDHFVHLALAQQMTFGALPVRDFVDPGLPLMSAFSALGQVLMGPGLHAELLLISFAFAVAAMLSGFVTARVSGSITIGLIAAALPVLVYPASYSYPKLLPYAAAFVAMWIYALRPTFARLIVVAAVIASAFLLRHDHGVILGCGTLVALAGRHGLSRQTLTVLGLCLATVLIVLSPYLIWVQANEGLGVYVTDGMAFSRREAEKATWALPTFTIDSSQALVTRLARRPVVNVQWQAEVPDAVVAQHEAQHGLTRLDPIGPRSWQYELSDWSRAGLRRLVTDPAVRDTYGINRSEFALEGEAQSESRLLRARLFGPGAGLQIRPNSVAALFYIVWLVPLVAVAIVVRTFTSRSGRLQPGGRPPKGGHYEIYETATRTVVLMAIVVQLAMDMTMLRDPLDTRIRDVLVPLAVLLAYIAGHLVYAPSRSLAKAVGLLAAVTVLGVPTVAAAAVGQMDERLELTQLSGGANGVASRIQMLQHEFEPPNDRTGTLPERYQPIVDYLRTCTPAGARLFTMTFAPELFFYTGSGFAAGLSSLTPGYYVTERHSSLMLDRLSHENVPFVVMDTDTMEEMPGNYPRVAAFVSGRYREVERFPIGTEKKFVVLAEIARQPDSRYGDKKLPCFAGTTHS